MEILKQFAETAPSTDGGIVSVLGINWMTLILQLVAFLVLVFVLGKFVFPWLLKSVDERQEKIEASTKALAEVQSNAADTEKRIAKLLTEARAEASDIVSTAKAEYASTLAAAEAKSKKRAEQIVADAKLQIDKDIIAAKKALHNEMLDLVTLATEKIVGKAVSGDIDNKLIVDAIKGDK